MFQSENRPLTEGCLSRGGGGSLTAGAGGSKFQPIGSVQVEANEVEGRARMQTSTVSLEQAAINTIRTLAMDAVQKANSGHPGTPMALAPVAYTVWTRFLKYDPEAPLWPNRDRFVLSCGHASMLLYSVLHLAGVKQVEASGQVTDELAVPLEHIKHFRQWGYRTPGHPESHLTTGVETTTGPLGQGVANSVGMALASRHLAARYNKPGFELFGFDTYAMCSDGDLMEGIASEAASTAGHLKLSNLCWIYDDNKITIEGDTDLAFSEDVPKRFEAYGWRTVVVDDANDVEALSQAIEVFRQTTDRPTLIVIKSQIAWGAPNAAGTHEAHGAPLGDEEIKLTKKAYGWPEDEQFLVPEEVPDHFKSAVVERGRPVRESWEATFTEYRSKYPSEAAEIDLLLVRKLPENWDAHLPEFAADAKGVASRASSGKVLQAVGKAVPWLVGGSADLAPSTKTLLEFPEAGGGFQAGNYGGRNLHFGVRELAMSAIVNGMTLTGLRGYGATFLVFSDYARPALRLAAIMEVPSLFIYTHDSIGVGEDGPTHQPIEHYAALRAIPNLLVFRPGDANEVAAAWRAIMSQTHRPSCLLLTRQNIPTLDRTKYASTDGVLRGGYILAGDAEATPELILMATGSELHLAVAAYEALSGEGVNVRLVSLPCLELFDEQPEDYRQQVLPSGCKARLAVEMGSSYGWHKYVGDQGATVSIDHYGASAPAGRLAKEFGFTADNVIAQARKLLK